MSQSCCQECEGEFDQFFALDWVDDAMHRPRLAMSHDDPFLLDCCTRQTARRSDGTFPTFEQNAAGRWVEVPRARAYRSAPGEGQALYFGLGSLGEPWAVSDYAVQGSVVAWGGKIFDSVGNAIFDEKVERAVKTALWNTGGFSWVDAATIAGFLQHYVSIKVTLRNDFSHLGDVLSVIEGAIWQSGFRPQTESFWLESVPQSQANRQDIAQSGAGGSTNPGPTATPGIIQDISDWWDSLSFPSITGGGNGAVNPNAEGFLDKLARWFGVTPSQALIVGVVGGIVIVFGVKRVL